MATKYFDGRGMRKEDEWNGSALIKEREELEQISRSTLRDILKNKEYLLPNQIVCSFVSLVFITGKICKSVSVLWESVFKLKVDYLLESSHF